MELAAPTTHDGVVEQAFVARRADREVPGHLWRPLEGPVAGLVLIGHGGSGDSRQGYVLALAQHLVREHEMACVAIDGPIHGRRRAEPSSADERLVLLEFMAAWSSDETMTDEMIADWQLVLDGALDLLGELPIGYWGLSMGTILGLPLVAAEPRIAAAVLGLCGAVGPTGPRLAADAAQIEVPALMLLQWDDELFARDGVLELFDALASTDKRLVAGPGAHGAVSIETFLMTASFLVDRLARAK